MLNIVFGFSPDLFYRKGGLQTQIKNSYEFLRQRGHNVMYYHEWLQNPCEIDIYHQFHYNISTYKLFLENKKLAKKIVVSPIFPTMNKINKLFFRTLGKIPKLNHNNYSQIRHLILNTDGYIFLGNNEKVQLENFYLVILNNYTMIPNGISIKKKSTKREVKKDYIVTVGTINPNKNQFGLIKACIDLKIPLKIIGPIGDNLYYERCLKIAKGNKIEFLGSMNNNSKEFLEIVSQAKLFALVSYSEVLPLSVFEALYLGTKVVCTKNCSIQDYVKDDSILLCNPSHFKDLKESIKTQYYSSMEVNRSVYDVYTWEKVAEKIENFYFKLLN